MAAWRVCPRTTFRRLPACDGHPQSLGVRCIARHDNSFPVGLGELLAPPLAVFALRASRSPGRKKEETALAFPPPAIATTRLAGGSGPARPCIHSQRRRSSSFVAVVCRLFVPSTSVANSASLSITASRSGRTPRAPSPRSSGPFAAALPGRFPRWSAASQASAPPAAFAFHRRNRPGKLQIRPMRRSCPWKNRVPVADKESGMLRGPPRPPADRSRSAPRAEPGAGRQLRHHSRRIVAITRTIPKRRSGRSV